MPVPTDADIVDGLHSECASSPVICDHCYRCAAAERIEALVKESDLWREALQALLDLKGDSGAD